ncbi:MAG: CRISPR-associated endonuclease Cas1, partial [Psychrobacter alimentarius]
YVGFFHADRPGRIGLALDMVEELRAYLGDRFVLSMINRGQISKVDFEIKENGATLLNDKGREKILAAWQKRQGITPENEDRFYEEKSIKREHVLKAEVNIKS